MVPFTKMQALGNDYLVVEPNQLARPMDSTLVRHLCDRHFGIGADGVLLGPTDRIIENGTETSVGLRIFNSDGSECEKSGNGLRMFAAYLRRNYLTSDGFVLEVLAGDCPVEIISTDPWEVSVDMGMAKPLGDMKLETPEGTVVAFDRVDIGNPHAIAFVPDATEELARSVGAWAAHHPAFGPDGTNVQLCTALDRQTLKLQIWERGAGYTLASGSSSCATAYSAFRAGYVDRSVTVTMPGGEVTVLIDNDRIQLQGRCEFVAHGSTFDS
ncbi:diaminopimelate epimerase [Nocardia suismassiliense]|uniref:diaminopimelate epimerase n=1 Tax=Nocardia suismassiliense TaxID=2077092 RepID=UPI000D1E4FDE|nr:diaminopimelate epimerase [Nocardia suismassiliense]